MNLSSKMRLNSRTCFPQSRRIRDRIKAVLLYDKGWTSQQIAEALLISDQTVRIHIEEYVASSKLRP